MTTARDLLVTSTPQPLPVKWETRNRWRAERVRPSELDDTLLTRWRSMPACSSRPFLRPEWVQRMADCQGNVHVGVLESAGEVVGFFPFQANGSMGRPVGDHFNDLQSDILDPSLQVSMPIEQLLKACKLSSLRFRHWQSPSDNLRRHCWDSHPFYYIDLSEGFQAYVESRRGSKRHKLRREIDRLRRKAEAEFSTISVQWSDDEEAVHQLLQWKSDQAQAMGWHPLDIGQTTAMLHAISTRANSQLSTRLAELRFGDRRVAAQLFLATGDVLHAWIRAYDAECAKFGPGHMLFWESARQAATEGIRRINWGAGEDSFKSRYASGAFPVHAGWADTSVLRSNARRVASKLYYRCRDSSWLVRRR